MFDVRFHYSEYCEEFYSGAFTVCEMMLVDVLEDDQALPVLRAADLQQDDGDEVDELVRGLIGSVLEAPGVDLNIGQLRRDAYSGSDPDWFLLPQWVFHVDLPVSINGKVEWLNFQVRCRVKWVKDHGPWDDVLGERSTSAVISDGVAANQNLLSYDSGDLLSAYHFDLLCEATAGIEETVWDLLLKGCSNEAEQHELRNGQALLQWFKNRAGAILGADKAEVPGEMCPHGNSWMSGCSDCDAGELRGE